jgi:hypothetical protein
MSVANRSLGRDVHIYDANNPATVLGGLVLTNGVTNANFYSMVEVFLLFDSNYVLRHEDVTEVRRDEEALQPGNYYIHTNGRFPPRLNGQLLTRSFNRVHHRQ